MKKNLLTATLLICLGLVTVHAKDDGDKKAKEMAKEKMEKAEDLKKDTEKVFKKLDVNKDTKLSADEFAVFKGNKGRTADDLKKALEELDADKDGSISSTEFKLPPEEKKGDKDKWEKKKKD